MNKNSIYYATLSEQSYEQGNRDRALSALNISEQMARTSFDWRSLIKAAQKIRPEHAPLLIQRFGDHFDDIKTQLECAEFALIDQDIDISRSYIGKAERLSETSVEWAECALLWAKLNDPDAAISCLNKAKVLAKRNWDWIAITESAVEMGIEEASALLDSVRKNAEDVVQLLCCVVLVRKIENEFSARETIKIAESISDSSCDWLLCAESWQELGISDQALRCVRSAYECSSQLFEFRSVAEKLIEDDWNIADQCLTRMLELAKDNQDFLDCALIALAQGKKNEAKRLMANAEGLAQKASDWGRTAEVWLKFEYSHHEATRCMALAEQKASELAELQEWLDCAWPWAEIFGEKEYAKECIMKGSHLAKTQEDLIGCAYFSADLGFSDLAWDVSESARLQFNLA